MNDAPVAVDDTPDRILSDGITRVTIDVLSNDSDADGDTLNVANLLAKFDLMGINPVNGQSYTNTIYVDAVDNGDGTWTITPPPTLMGPFRFHMMSWMARAAALLR